MLARQYQLQHQFIFIFDISGKSLWATYFRQSEAASLRNQWSDVEKANTPTLALRSPAAELLKKVLQEKLHNYKETVTLIIIFW